MVVEEEEEEGDIHKLYPAGYAMPHLTLTECTSNLREQVNATEFGY